MLNTLPVALLAPAGEKLSSSLTAWEAGEWDSIGELPLWKWWDIERRFCTPVWTDFFSTGDECKILWKYADNKDDLGKSHFKTEIDSKSNMCHIYKPKFLCST